jgi:excisionase family DNA binding protein
MTTGAIGDDEGLLTEQDAAELLQVPLSTLRRWQREGAGPPCLKIGRQVRYRQVAVQRWLTGGRLPGRQPLAPHPSAPAANARVSSGSLRATASCR